jgi:hypothetical protein
MVVAQIQVLLVDVVELAGLVKAMAENGLHCNIRMCGKYWVVEVTL